MAGKKAELGGKLRNLQELISRLSQTAENPDLSPPIVVASGTKCLVKIRYAAGTLKHLAVSPLVQGPSTGKRLFWFEMAVLLRNVRGQTPTKLRVVGATCVSIVLWNP